MTAPIPVSGRLLFRAYTRVDEQNVLDLFADPAARTWYPEMGSVPKVRRWIEWNIENYRTYGYGLWALERKDSGAFVGDCGLTWQDVEGRPELEIGYHVVDRERRHGYATEAARACLDFALAHTDATLICSIVSPSNLASCAVARRIHEACREFVRGGKRTLLFYTFRRI